KTNRRWSIGASAWWNITRCRSTAPSTSEPPPIKSRAIEEALEGREPSRPQFWDDTAAVPPDRSVQCASLLFFLFRDRLAQSFPALDRFHHHGSGALPMVICFAMKLIDRAIQSCFNRRGGPAFFVLAQQHIFQSRHECIHCVIGVDFQILQLVFDRAVSVEDFFAMRAPTQYSIKKRSFPLAFANQVNDCCPQ